MSWTPNIPQVGQSLGSSRPQVLNNFAFLFNTIGVNHGVTTNIGKHLQVEMPRQATVPVTLANEGTLYTALSTDGINTDMQYTCDADATKVYQMTRIDLTKFPLFADYVNYPIGSPTPNQFGGYTFLPGGLLLQYGQMRPTGKNTVVGFPVVYNAPPFAVVATVGELNDYFVAPQTYTTSQFTFSLENNPITLNNMAWIAIGF